MQYTHKVKKTIQAVARLFDEQGVKQMENLRLLKLLYIADRESLRDTGRPITYDRVAAMKHGPVLSGTSDLVGGKHAASHLWSKFLRNAGCCVEMIDDPGIGELSRFELDKLKEVAQRYADKDTWSLAEETHEFPEWKRNQPNGEAQPIPIEHILEAVGRGQDEKAILQDLADEAAYDRVFARTPS